MRLLLVLVFTFGILQASADNEEIYIPTVVAEAYNKIELTDVQMPIFDRKMLVAIEDVKTTVRRESQKGIWKRHRKIQQKAKSTMEAHLPDLIEVIDAEQHPAFIRYKDLVLDILSSPKPTRHKLVQQ